MGFFMSDFIKDIIQSLKKTSTERITNPFYGVMIITWLAFNWEAVTILFFSEMNIDARIKFIKVNYPLSIFFPLIVSIILTFLLPWCTEKITYFQSKPLGRTSSLLALRKKKMLQADISVERVRAKKDVEYERYKVGAEKEIQKMRESIIESKETTGRLTQELEEAKKIASSFENSLSISVTDNQSIREENKNLTFKNKSLTEKLNSQTSDIDELTQEISTLKGESLRYHSNLALIMTNEKENEKIIKNIIQHAEHIIYIAESYKKGDTDQTVDIAFSKASFAIKEFKEKIKPPLFSS